MPYLVRSAYTYVAGSATEVSYTFPETLQVNDTVCAFVRWPWSQTSSFLQTITLTDEPDPVILYNQWRPDPPQGHHSALAVTVKVTQAGSKTITATMNQFSSLVRMNVGAIYRTDGGESQIHEDVIRGNSATGVPTLSFASAIPAGSYVETEVQSPTPAMVADGAQPTGHTYRTMTNVEWSDGGSELLDSNEQVVSWQNSGGTWAMYLLGITAAGAPPSSALLHMMQQHSV